MLLTHRPPAGLHAFQLRIRTDGIRIDGEKAAYQLREYPPEQTPEDLLQQAPPRTGGTHRFAAETMIYSRRDWVHHRWSHTLL